AKTSASRSISAPRQERRYRRSERFRSGGNRFDAGMGDRYESQPPVSAPLAPPPGATGAAPEFSHEVQITADPATNSLLISASPQDFATLRAVIEKLDVRRRQV